jgi:hypothetical protein
VTAEERTFTCSICQDPSTAICVFCTKDACPNHLCRRCSRCSDCCSCDVPLDEAGPEVQAQPEPADSPVSS